LVAICKACDQRKTPRDLKDIAKTKRLALDHHDFVGRMRDKVPGRPVPSKARWQKMKREMGTESDSAGPRLSRGEEVGN
jgi:hypothetical protein